MCGGRDQFYSWQDLALTTTQFSFLLAQKGSDIGEWKSYIGSNICKEVVRHSLCPGRDIQSNVVRTSSNLMDWESATFGSLKQKVKEGKKRLLELKI